MLPWYVFSLTTAIFSAAAAIIEKKILFKEKALSFTTILALFNLILAIPFFILTDITSLTMISLATLLIKSILGGLAFLCIMQAIKKLELSSALPLLILSPGLVAVFAYLALGEALSNYEILGLLLLTSGTYVLGLRKGQKLFDPFTSLIKNKGTIYILIALSLFTITSILDKALLKNFKVPVNALMGYQHLFYAIFFIIILIFSKEKLEIKNTLKQSKYPILILSVITIVYRYFHILAIKESSVALALSIKRISIFFAVLVGGELFKEKNMKRKLIATVMMVIGALIMINF